MTHNWTGPHREWRCKECGKIVRRRTHHKQLNGVYNCLSRSFEQVVWAGGDRRVISDEERR